jgi:hypothetical protein
MFGHADETPAAMNLQRRPLIVEIYTPRIEHIERLEWGSSAKGWREGLAWTVLSSLEARAQHECQSPPTWAWKCERPSEHKRPAQSCLRTDGSAKVPALDV